MASHGEPAVTVVLDHYGLWRTVKVQPSQDISFHCNVYFIGILVVDDSTRWAWKIEQHVMDDGNYLGGLVGRPEKGQKNSSSLIYATQVLLRGYSIII